MRKIVLLAAMALTLAGCQTAREDRSTWWFAHRRRYGRVDWRSALVDGRVPQSAGGLVGAAAGAIIADATRPGRCYYYTRSGHRRYVRCR